MNPFDLVLKGISQVIVSYADGLNLIANQIDSFMKNQSEGTVEHEKKTEEPAVKYRPSPESEKEPEQRAGDIKKTKSSISTFSKETKKPSQKVSGQSSKPMSHSKSAMNETPRPRAASKTEAKTDTGKVLQVISKSSSGVNVDTISKETGFDRTKIYGIVARLKKQDKIKSPKMGLYKKT